jgi:hypothetical protein
MHSDLNRSPYDLVDALYVPKLPSLNTNKTPTVTFNPVGEFLEYEVDHDNMLLPVGERSSTGSPISLDRLPERMQESRHNIEREQMHYDKSQNRFSIKPDAGKDYYFAHNMLKESFAAYNACEKHLTSYKRTQNPRYMKLYRISLDEAISWLEMFISSTVLLDDDQIRTSFGHESSHFEVLLAKYEFKRNRLDESQGGGGDSDAVDDVLDDITDDVSDNFIELDSGEFKSKSYKHEAERKKFKKHSRRSADLVTELYNRPTVDTSRHKTRKNTITFDDKHRVREYELDDASKPMRPTGPRSETGYDINPKLYKRREKLSKDHVLTERMPYDGERVRFEHPVEMHHNPDTLEQAKNAYDQGMATYTQFLNFKSKYMANKDNFYYLKLSRQKLDEVIEWMTMFNESINGLDQDTVVRVFGYDANHFSDRLLEFHRTKSLIDKQFDSFFSGGASVAKSSVQCLSLLAITVVAAFAGSFT